MTSQLFLLLALFSLHGHSLQTSKDGLTPVEDPIFRIDVFKAEELEYECFRIPSLLFTSKGTLLAFAEGRGQHSNSCSDHGDVHIVLKRSTDLGHTWSNMTVVYTEYPHNTIGEYLSSVYSDSRSIKVIKCAQCFRKLI
jgi:Neuraminidase (sialidase)